MEHLGMALTLLIAILLLLIGLLIKYKKAYWLISGYNTMSWEDKQHVNIDGLGISIANLCFELTIICIISAILIYYGKASLTPLILAMMIPIIIYHLIVARKFHQQINVRSMDNQNHDNNKKTISNTAITIIIVATLILVPVGLGAQFYFIGKPVSYELQDGVFRISGAYGKEISINKISNIELIYSIPKVIFRMNGLESHSILKGYFRLENIGEAELLVDKSKPPYIEMKSDAKTYIFNCENSEKTKELYQSLREECQTSLNK